MASAGGSCWVDPAAGTREPAFDHVLLAAALAAASGQQVDPEALPFMAIELAGNAVESYKDGGPDAAHARLKGMRFAS